MDLGLVGEASTQELLGIEVGVVGELEQCIGVLFGRSVDEGVSGRAEGAEFFQDGSRFWEIQFLRLPHSPHFLPLDALLFVKILSEHLGSSAMVLLQLFRVSDILAPRLCQKPVSIADQTEDAVEIVDTFD